MPGGAQARSQPRRTGAKAKFKVRYSTLGFQHDARLDDGEMWPVAFALAGLTPAAERRIAELVKRAAG